MLNRKKEETYESVSIDITLFDGTDVILTSGESYSPDDPEENLGMWT